MTQHTKQIDVLTTETARLNSLLKKQEKTLGKLIKKIGVLENVLQEQNWLKKEKSRE